MRNAAQISHCSRFADKNAAGMIVATGTYVAHVPEALHRVTDEAGFPIIELPWEIPFEDVVRVVSEHSTSDQYFRYKQSTAIHRALPSSIANMSTRWRRSRSCPRSVEIGKKPNSMSSASFTSYMPCRPLGWLKTPMRISSSD